MTPERADPAEETEKTTVWVGTSGFSFPDWAGTFYPQDLPKSEWLPYYAGRFSALELNSSYYRIPSAKTMTHLCERTPPGFLFMVKANKKTTHQRADAEVAEEFRACLQPLIEAGRLRGVLAQFPWSFRNTEENRDYLVSIAERTSDVQWFAEFRRRDWIVPLVGNLLRERRIGFVSVDEPQISDMVPPVAKFTVPVAYVRFHGRNAEAWWGRGTDQARDRYDYLYSEEELRLWTGKIERLRGKVKEIFLFFNNCHDGQAAENAVLMRDLLSRLAHMEVR
jgi:uncharacterized protein YecE (DUF72 family)